MMTILRPVFLALLVAITLPACSVVPGATVSLADGRGAELAPGMSKREVEALLGRAPYAQPDKVRGAERWVYVNTSTRTASILQFQGDELTWFRQEETTSDWPNDSMRR
jgi:outer membrane protein assembly factor BamE (lipoprotein component of BamABCDE complex)